MRLQKTVAYHSSRGVPVRELSDRCDRTLDRAARHGLAHYVADQRGWYADFWDAADVEIVGDDRRAPRGPAGDPLQPVQPGPGERAGSTASGVPAKGVTGSGLRGPLLLGHRGLRRSRSSRYTQPEVARNALHFRSVMLPAARERAREMAQSGAMFPWRTINGEEASAYYAAGSAQVHIDADIAYALMQVRPRDRRRGLPGPRGHRHPRRDRADVGRPGLLAQQRRRRPSTSTASPGRTSTRPSSTTTCSPT